MKVPTLRLNYDYIAIDKDGNEFKVTGWGVCGTTEMVWELEEKFGIITSRTTVYKATATFTSPKFPHEKSKQYMLGWCNWVLNYPKGEREKFFEDEPNKQKFYENNPIVDIKIRISK